MTTWADRFQPRALVMDDQLLWRRRGDGGAEGHVSLAFLGRCVFWIQKSKGNPIYPWSIPQTPDIPKPPNERNSFINCWLGVWGMLQGSVGKVLEIYKYIPGTPNNQFFMVVSLG